jgi:hypothetical protein
LNEKGKQKKKKVRDQKIIDWHGSANYKRTVKSYQNAKGEEPEARRQKEGKKEVVKG